MTQTAKSLFFVCLCACVSFSKIKPEETRFKHFFNKASRHMSISAQAKAIPSWLKSLPFISFSRFNTTWFNKEKYALQEEYQTQFNATHECAHHALWHNIKELAACAACIVGPCVVIKSTLGKCAAVTLLLGTVWPYLSRTFEQEADENAARVLCEMGHAETVKCVIEDLKEISGQDDYVQHLLFGSTENRIKTLEIILEKHGS